MRRTFFIGGLLILVMAAAFFIGAGASLRNSGDAVADPEPNDEPEIEEPVDPEPEPEPEPDIRSITLVAAGDITAHEPQITQAHAGDGTYDFSPTFEFITPYIQRGDLAVGNLETCQAGPEISFLDYQGYTGYPCFNAPIELSEALKEAGFDFVSTAHNHSMDRGLSGLKATLENIRAAGLTTFGTYLNQKEHDTPVISEVDGVKVAFLSYTFSTNVIPVPEGHEYAVNFIENFHTVEPITDEIDRARAAGADIVAISMHWGDMYVTEPQEHSRHVAAELAAAGADLILGGHPHVVQPIEWIYTEEEDGFQRPTMVTYSMGNFLSNQRYPNNPTDLVQYGNILEIEISKEMDSGRTWISDVNYEITWVHRDWRHRILPLSEVLAAEPSEFNLDAAQLEQLQQGHLRNEEIIEKYGFSDDAPAELR
ncbi:MAG: CapA family protein [Bacillota bacterium]